MGYTSTVECTAMTKKQVNSHGNLSETCSFNCKMRRGGMAELAACLLWVPRIHSSNLGLDSSNNFSLFGSEFGSWSC